MKFLFSRFLTAAITAAGMVAPAPALPVSQNMELMGAIAREIVNSGEPQGVDWVEVSAIFSIDADGDVNGSYGYVYDARGQAHAAAFLEDPIEREVKAYRDWLLHKGRKGDKGIIKMLFQFNRQTRRVRADFEYEDPRRWQVTPANLDARVKELRPHLGAADGK
ncbi:hypothetical protein [Variovorax sp.]|jgi:hypothetical protein|uniref:hypothetical protein n=1 Tax=Variovorax sp. TaxID=1871043 RepID=UPI000AA12336|nr:hypothetical protein [Variovorax sp.]